MITEFHFFIHWSWVIWTVVGIVAIALVGGVGALMGYSRGYNKGSNLPGNLPPSVSR